ncbi:hypothetical protein CLV47_102306 [Antricoccus suffuscus]|uniref:Uncharacterized protein n=1 Tax=Antricoccus suffuscus TaxID=1629062 RepID=A0A2T1A4T5_9ACTN|nr:hypothetical protein [Antricoccus suffuscus]PRZ43615.1 hypothetical protein CLV47_102306 [Antricoccus suffuscus]
MTANRKDSWRDLAASIADQISENIRNPRHPDEDGRRYRHDDYWRGHGGPRRTRGWATRGPYRYGPQDPVQDDARQPSSDRPSGKPQPPGGKEIASDFKNLLSASVKATTESINERRTGRNERIRMRPVRRLRHQRVRQIAASGLFGLCTIGFAGGAAAAVNDGQAALAIPMGVGAVALGTGAGLTGTRARKTGKRADALEEKLSPVSIDVPSYEEREEAPQSLPPKNSAAYQPIRKLRAQRRLLQQLLPDLREIAPDISAIARESEQSLERQARRAVLLERTLAESGATDGTELDESGGIRASLDKIVQRLEDGVSAHERLVAGAASVVAELDSSAPEITPAAKARDAADGLHALAEGLREVSNPSANHAQLDSRPARPDSRATVDPGADASLPPSYGPPKASRQKPKRKPTGQES